MPRGIDCKLYRNSAALGAGYATPTFNEVASIKDLEYTLTTESFETTTRLEGGIKTYEQTVADLEISFMLRLPEPAATTGDPNYDDYIAIRTAFNTNLVIDAMMLTGTTATNGAEGFRGFFKVSDFSESQGHGDSLFKKVVLKPSCVDATTLASTAAAQAMRRVKIAAGAPTYANWGSDTFA